MEHKEAIEMDFLNDVLGYLKEREVALFLLVQEKIMVVDKLSLVHFQFIGELKSFFSFLLGFSNERWNVRIRQKQERRVSYQWNISCLLCISTLAHRS